MTDTNFPLTADTDLDDLPRTLRREHEARRARERDRRESMTDAVPISDRSTNFKVAAAADAPPATVTAFDVPFAQLVAFFLKSVLAAIPALILLTVILWFIGQALQTYFPELVKMRILITFPNG